jgi:hypothetical protein
MANAVGFIQIKSHREKAVIFAESFGVSADIFGSEIAFHALSGDITAIIYSVNYAGYNAKVGIVI